MVTEIQRIGNLYSRAGKVIEIRKACLGHGKGHGSSDFYVLAERLPVKKFRKSYVKN